MKGEYRMLTKEDKEDMSSLADGIYNELIKSFNAWENSIERIFHGKAIDIIRDEPRKECEDAHLEQILTQQVNEAWESLSRKLIRNITWGADFK
jgi:hypothetical protein